MPLNTQTVHADDWGYLQNSNFICYASSRFWSPSYAASSTVRGPMPRHSLSSVTRAYTSDMQIEFVLFDSYASQALRFRKQLIRTSFSGEQSLPNSARVEVRTSLLLFRWHEAIQLFRPVQHDVDLRRRRLLAFDGPEHQEPLPIR